MLDNTHSIFIQSKGQKILSGVAEVRKHELDGECLQNFLYKVSRVIVSAKLVKILSDLQNNHSILFIKTKMRDESLEGMSSLLIFYQVAETRHYLLQYLKSLVRMANWKQFLNHIVPIFVHDKLHSIWLDVSDNQFYITWTCLAQVVLEYTRLCVIFDKLNQFVASYQFLKVNLLNCCWKLRWTLVGIAGNDSSLGRRGLWRFYCWQRWLCLLE